MSIIHNTTRQLLRDGQLAIGLGLRNLRTMDSARIAKACGFDWLFIDMEHGSYDLDLACQLSVAALDSGVTPIVRVPGHQHFHAARVLDGGAMGIVVPHVDDAEQAAAAVANCKFPPIGHRSMTGTHAQLGFASMPLPEMTKVLNENLLLVVMIETPRAVENADAIAALDGIDVLLIGTNDLCAEMGIHGQFGDARVEAAYRTVIDACQRHGKSAGMGGVYDEELAARYIGMGARFVLGGSDLSFLMSAAGARSKFLKSLA
ncbi:MAG: aldolase [Gammaproteobacteria bacterium]|nr:aldolase [Gammaproteobacteria bacterium]